MQCLSGGAAEHEQLARAILELLLPIYGHFPVAPKRRMAAATCEVHTVRGFVDAGTAVEEGRYGKNESESSDRSMTNASDWRARTAFLGRAKGENCKVKRKNGGTTREREGGRGGGRKKGKGQGSELKGTACRRGPSPKRICWRGMPKGSLAPMVYTPVEEDKWEPGAGVRAQGHLAHNPNP